MTVEVTNPTHWGQFGIAGLVIAALFSVLGYGIKLGIAQFRNIADTHEGNVKEFRTEHAKERAEWRKEHADEREQWRSSYVSHRDDLKVVVQSLTEVVWELKQSKKEKQE